MIWIVIAVVIFAVALFVLSRRFHGKHEGEEPQYQRLEALFTPAERSFLGVLHKAIGNNATIFGKVRVADVVEPKAGLSRSARQKAFNKISAKHFDFLVCDKEDLSVACAIELDDGSHNSKRRQERDEFLNGVCEAAGVPLIQVPAKSGYVISEVIALLPTGLTNSDHTDPNKTVPTVPHAPENKGKVCPNCSSDMVKRVATKGNHAGKQFWACSAFPKCKTIEEIAN